METSNVCHYCLNKVNRTQWLEGIEDVHFLQYVVLALSTIIIADVNILYSFN